MTAQCGLAAADATLAPMIIWLNGTFGVGKTTTSQLLVKTLPAARLRPRTHRPTARPDPGGCNAPAGPATPRPWVVLVDGARHQLELIEAEGSAPGRPGPGGRGTGGGGEVLVNHAEAAAEQRRALPSGRPCLGFGRLANRGQDGLGDAQLDRCDVGGGEPLARSRRAASTPAWVKWLHGYGLKTTRGSSQFAPRPRTAAAG